MAGSNKSFTYIWKLENFSMLPHRSGDKLISPSFTVDFLCNTDWCLNFYPRGKIQNDAYMSCFLSREDYKLNMNTFDVGLSIVVESTNNFNEVVKTSESIAIGDAGKGFYCLCLRSLVFKNTKWFLPRDVLTIRCHVWLSGPNIESPINDTLTDAFRKQCSVLTVIPVHWRSFTRSVSNIDQLVKSRKGISFISESTFEGTPSLKVSFDFSDDLTKELSQVKIHQISSSQSERSLFVKCKITVLGSDPENEDSHVASHTFDSSSEVWIFTEHLKMDKLLDPKHVIVDNTVYFHFEFAFSREGTEYHLEAPHYESHVFVPKRSSESLSYLTNGIRHLYASGKFCDVTVRVGDASFPCHKVALCAQSPVFSAMFENDMLEKNTGMVEVKDLDPNTVERMLSFIHTDVLEDTLTNGDACLLYEAAHKYQVHPLTSKCSLQLLSTMSVKNVCDVLALADRHQDHFLLVNVNHFLSIHAGETISSRQWEKFMEDFPKLSGKVMLQLWRKKSFL